MPDNRQITTATATLWQRLLRYPLILGGGFSTLLFVLVIQISVGELERDFTVAAEGAAIDFREHLHEGEVVLNGINLFFRASQHVDNEEFTLFLHDQLNSHTEIKSVQFLAHGGGGHGYARPESQSAMMASIEIDGERFPLYSLYRITPSDNSFSEPGWEVWNAPRTTEALRETIISGEITLGDMVVLDEGTVAFSQYKAVYSRESENQLLGVIAVLFRPAEILTHVGVDYRLNSSLRVGERAAGGASCCLEQSEPLLPLLSYEEEFEFYGVPLRLTFSRGLGWADIHMKLAVLAFVIGALLSVAMQRLRMANLERTQLLIERNRTIKRQVDQQTRELRQLNAELTQQKAALDEHAIVSIADTSGNIIYVNEKFCEASGYSGEELLGHNHRIVKSDLHPATFYNEMWGTITQGKIWHGVVCNRRKDGKAYWVNSTIVPFLDEKGVPYQYVSIRTDVTHMVETERALQQNEERLRRSQNFANIGTWDWNIQSGDLFWSERIAPLFGYGVGELETTYENFINAVHPEDRELVTSAVGACVESGAEYNIEHRVVWPDGTVRWLSEKGDVVRDAQGQPLHMLGVVTDIHERKMAELQLNRFKTTLDVTQDGVFMFDPQTLHFFYVNYGATEQVGYSREELMCMHPYDLKPDYNEEAFRALIAPLIESRGGSLTFDTEHQHRNGSCFPAEISLQYIAPENEPARFVSIVRNITERKQMQQKLVEAKEQAELANKAKSEFLSSMSHELRTPLNAILGFTQLLKGDENITDDQQESLNDISTAGGHLLDLINDVLDLAKIEAGKMELSIDSVAVADVMGAAQKLIVPMAQKRGMSLRFAENCFAQHFIRADFTRVKQVVLNLLSNAVKYNRDEGVISVSCEQQPSGYMRISVSDTGRGIPEIKRKGLFEAFNRLDAEGSNIEGTGIGLVITRQLVELMGGQIGVESVVDEGSTFWFELPRGVEGAVRERRAEKESVSNNVMLGAGRRVLYIEDNPVNLKLVSKMIEKRTAITLLSAEEPVAGLQLAAENQPDLILLDINLPQMSGYEVLRHLREMAETREIPVIALSANAMVEDLRRGEEAGFNGYLTKPINVKEFFAVLEHYLGA
ncbi:MAG: PAS domain S-box protein [Chromatiales bacterium]|nr:PAS domain S-box protein [Chromatiales bacterium]